MNIRAFWELGDKLQVGSVLFDIVGLYENTALLALKSCAVSDLLVSIPLHRQTLFIKLV